MLVSTGAHDVFMACFSSNGRHCWSRALGGARSSASVEGVVADRRGGITALGSFSGTLALDSGTVRTRGDCPHAVDTVLFSLLV